MTTKQMSNDEFARRSADDFRFMVLCHAKGKYAMYDVLRDRELDAERARRSASTQTQVDNSIPKFSISVRHPQYGWQVVEVCSTEIAGREGVTMWAARGWPVTLRVITGDQVWTVLASANE